MSNAQSSQPIEATTQGQVVRFTPTYGRQRVTVYATSPADTATMSAIGEVCIIGRRVVPGSNDPTACSRAWSAAFGTAVEVIEPRG